MKNKSFSITVFFTTALLISLLALFNYFFDSYGFFQHNKGLSSAAKAIGQGKIVAGLENYDERLFQKQIYHNFEKTPDCIALGSSKSMMIESNMVTCHGKFFNHSVSDASLEDYITITGIYAKEGKLPKKIILGIDAWIFNKNTGRGDWEILKEEYSFMLSQISSTKDNKINDTKNNYSQLINFDNTIYNIKHLNKNNLVKVVTNDNIDSSIKRADGSIEYPYKIRFQSDAETKKNALNYISGKVYNLENFDQLSNIQLFEDFIDYLQKHGVEVEFFLPPYHPIVYDYISKNIKYHNVLNVEDYLNNFAHHHKIKIVGSYNPHKYGLTSKDFTDGMHSKSYVSAKILK
ncbi:MAG: hypothetical protein PHQ90_10310 [Sulfuricurvum sp.]|uniref:hypothetical protein n=1 Tax=Sulfuricurvum sp. TaxID=2025608 RepID=UPI00262B796C|nr:hypothetical protein [Sulfuricurvum sp.]MDD2369685.1 hypothetical protein [Sulfuricurvum sp.]MDD2951226.1 hypothetical protein [Sulfuricurvum sp.]MDD5119578.1 hypothetical protein [Sulfuricurvum sp.]